LSIATGVAPNARRAKRGFAVDKTSKSLILFFYRGRLRSRQAVVRLDAQTVAYFAAMLVLIGLAGWLYLHQASQVAAYAHEIRQLEQRKEERHRELVALRGQVAMLGSLERTLTIGRQAGYRLPKITEGDDQLHLVVDQAPGGAHTSASAQDRSSTQRGASAIPYPQNGGTELRSGFFESLIDQLLTWMEIPIDEPGTTR
jgi:cell division protein FtsL